VYVFLCVLGGGGGGNNLIGGSTGFERMSFSPRVGAGWGGGGVNRLSRPFLRIFAHNTHF
jgi:hypothetical protein